MPLLERLVLRERLDERFKILRQKLAMWAFRFSFEISFESAGLLKLSH